MTKEKFNKAMTSALDIKELQQKFVEELEEGSKRNIGFKNRDEWIKKCQRHPIYASGAREKRMYQIFGARTKGERDEYIKQLRDEDKKALQHLGAELPDNISLDHYSLMARPQTGCRRPGPVRRSQPSAGGLGG